MKTFLVLRVIAECAPLIIGGKDKTVLPKHIEHHPPVLEKILKTIHSSQRLKDLYSHYVDKSSKE